MNAVASVLSRGRGPSADEALKILVICGVVLAVSLLLASLSAHVGPAPSAVGLDVMNWI
jgi:hypothetical protein